jgi:ATP-binding cassette subfamily F protein 3
MAGLLLGPYNILVLDEPGNHLDVETVDALAQALLASEGTVIFTSHDRSFMQTVATNVIEVKDGRVINYIGDYSAYLAAVTKEIDDAEAADSGRVASRKPPPADRVGKAATTPAAKGETPRNDRDLRRELSNLERSIAKLDTEKKQANAAMLAATDAAEALRLHTQLTAVTAKLAEAEERWLAIQDQLGAE